MTTYDVAILGGGPAGASAAVFTARAKLATLLIDADAGMTRRALIHNHLGFPEGITGPELVEKGHAHAQKAGATFVKAKVKSIEKGGAGFVIVAEDGTKHDAKQVIVASGVNLEVAKQLGVTT